MKLFKDAYIYDGTGADAFKGDILVENDRIVKVEEHITPEEEWEVIDLDGLSVSSGFIDAHSHGDILLGTRDNHLFKTNPGITTEIVGQCGDSMAPVSPKYLTEVQDQLSMGTPSFPDDMVNWTSFARYLEYADAQKKTTNVKMYIGHSSLRIAVMGMENRPSTDQELDTMKGILRESMEAGAAGFSVSTWYVLPLTVTLVKPASISSTAHLYSAPLILNVNSFIVVLFYCLQIVLFIR